MEPNSVKGHLTQSKANVCKRSRYNVFETVDVVSSSKCLVVIFKKNVQVNSCHSILAQHFWIVNVILVINVDLVS